MGNGEVGAWGKVKYDIGKGEGEMGKIEKVNREKGELGYRRRWNGIWNREMGKGEIEVWGKVK